MKEVVLETAEDDIEEIPHLPGLPNVNQREEPGTVNIMNLCIIDFHLIFTLLNLTLQTSLLFPGDVMMGKKSAFTESSSLSSETEEEFSLETSDLINQRPPSSRWLFS